MGRPTGILGSILADAVEKRKPYFQSRRIFLPAFSNICMSASCGCTLKGLDSMDVIAAIATGAAPTAIGVVPGVGPGVF